MRNINTNSLANAKSRFLTLMLAVSMLAASVTATSPSVATASASLIRKVQQVQHESREMIRFSLRLYRFYKLSSERPVMQASACE